MVLPVSEPFLTLEPLIDAIRDAVQGAGWELSGLQKTTSHQFEGRWEGESTRSAYLFFHRADGPEYASIDVYLDETSRGLAGNIALVVDLVPLDALGAPPEVLTALARLSEREIGNTQRRPITLRFRLPDSSVEATSAETEVRFKVRLPRSFVEGGSAMAGPWVTEMVGAFMRILGSPEVAMLADTDDEAPADEGATGA